MAPNTSRSSGDVCVEDARSSLSLDAFDVSSVVPLASPPAIKQREHAVIFFDWGELDMRLRLQSSLSLSHSMDTQTTH
jgi:hypothetical protein